MKTRGNKCSLILTFLVFSFSNIWKRIFSKFRATKMKFMFTQNCVFRGDTLRLYNALMDVGESYGIVNFGQSTLNMMRIENGYKIWGREVSVLIHMFHLFFFFLTNFSQKVAS